MSTARSLSSVLTSSPSPFYTSNVGFDTQRKGSITLGDLSQAVARAASTSTVQHAIAQTYQLRPGESPRDPTLGTDFGFQLKDAVMIGGAALVLASAVAYAYEKKPAQRRRRVRAYA